ncbi:phage tail tape measure protein [Corynebacterium diphtheriae]|uniref:phage tail tape measure protein n=1 Tax=Corynebacterium diphtheriae TaxID=1717 RepID=UPI00335F4383
MGLQLPKLSIEIEAKTAGFESQMAKADATAKRVKQSLDAVGKSKVTVKADDRDLTKVEKSSKQAKAALEGVSRTKITLGVDGDGKLTRAKKSADELSASLDKVRQKGSGLSISPSVGDGLEQATRKAERLSGAMGSVKNVAGFAAASAGITGIGAAFSKTLALGNDYTNQMNTLTAVTGATEKQLAAASQRAKELGNDVSLPATSAGDAAAAMTELAKGGFTVEQAMEAAKGTLQLSAAAQIDAATAATIQSQALQAFGKDASFAAQASDILSGAANASSAEITGIAQGLQQSGTVANQFGVTMEDTATTLAMLANAGIQGSDAGTLMKSALLALTDQGKPAQAAIEELGLTVYDTNGKFVGMESLMGQLNKAAKKMTDEQYQAATATLFGSDAMRLAGVAAQHGSEDFAKLRDAVTRQGQAAEVAAAKTHGLPGAISQVGNALEDVGLKAYGVMEGPLTSVFEKTATVINAFSDHAGSIPWAAWAAGAALFGGRISGTFKKLDAGTGKLKKLSTEIQGIRTAAAQTGTSVTGLGATFQALGKHSATIERANGAYMRGASRLSAVAVKHREAANAARLHALASRDTFTAIDRIGSQASHSFVAGVSRMGAAASGAAMGGMSLMKSAAGGLMNALGGPWGLAIMAGTAALGYFAQKHQEAAAAEEEHKAKVDSLTESLERQTGAVTESTRKQMIDRAEKDGSLKDAETAGVSKGTVVDAMTGNAVAMQEITNKVNAVTASFKDLGGGTAEALKGFEAMGVTSRDLASALGGNDDAIKKIAKGGRLAQADFEVLKSKLSETDLATLRLAESTRKASGDLDSATEAAKRKAAADDVARRVLRQTADAMDLVGKSVIGITSEKTISVKADAVTDETRKKLEDIGVKVGQPFEGAVSLEFPNGIAIRQALEEIGIKIEALPDGHIAITDNSEETISKLQALGLETRTLPDGQVVIKSNTPEEQEKMIKLGILVCDGATGQVTISDNFDPTLAKIREVKAADGRKTSETHTITLTERRIQYWESQGYSSAQASRIQGPVPVGRATGGTIPGYAGGYKLPATGPGTDVVDGFLGVDDNGMPLARVNAREWVINADRSDEFNTTLAAINSGSKQQIMLSMLRDLRALETGGRVDGSARVKSALSGMNGTPYVFGGFSPAGTDCSGAVSMGVNAYLGLDPLDSRTSTTSIGAWLTQKGFEQGRGSDGDLVVGWYDHGGGMNGHTAMQLPDGTFIESGGNTGGGLTIGGSAGPLDGRGFTNFMHLKGGGPTGDLGGGSSGGSSRGGSSGGYSPISIGTGGISVSAAAQRMGLTGSIGSVFGGDAGVQQLAAAGRNAGFGGLVDSVLGASIGQMGQLLLVTEETVAAFNELGQARHAELDAVESIQEAEERLAEARRDAAKDGGAAAEKIADKERDLEKARASGKPDQIEKAERDLKKAREDAPDKANQSAKKIADAEKRLREARAKSAQSAEATAVAEAKYRVELIAAPFKMFESVLSYVGSLSASLGEMFTKLADKERQRLEQAKEALDIWSAQVDAQKALQDATVATTDALHEQTSDRWKSNLAVADAEWELSMHRKRSVIEVAEATAFATNADEVQARATRRTATLEAQVAFEKAKRDLLAFERELNLANASAELEHSHKMAEIQTSRLALVSGALADVQSKLNIENMKHLDAMAQRAQGLGGILGGIGGIGGAVGKLIGAVGMASVNPIGALVMGLQALPGVFGGIGGLVTGIGAMKAAKRREEGSKNPGAITGLGSGSLEALELKEKQLQIDFKKEQLQRQKDTATQHDLLRKLVDNAEKNLELAKRDEKHADDLNSLFEDSKTTNATAFFQLGGSGWDGGRAAKKFSVDEGGFAGIKNGRLGPDSSLRVEGSPISDDMRSAMTEGRITSPAVAGAAAAVMNARESSAIRVRMETLISVAERIEAVVASTDRIRAGESIGTVFNGPVTLTNPINGGLDERRLAAAMSTRG